MGIGAHRHLIFPFRLWVCFIGFFFSRSDFAPGKLQCLINMGGFGHWGPSLSSQGFYPEHPEHQLWRISATQKIKALKQLPAPFFSPSNKTFFFNLSQGQTASPEFILSNTVKLRRFLAHYGTTEVWKCKVLITSANSCSSSGWKAGISYVGFLLIRVFFIVVVELKINSRRGIVIL